VIDVPYADGFDVLGRGRVESRTTPGREGSMAVLTGLKVGLVSTDGSAEYGGEAFDDGTILVEGVSAGYYRIVFDDAQLAARGLRAAGLPAMVYLNNAGRTLPPISFAPRDPSGAPAR
jgi:hypothetical protein